MAIRDDLPNGDDRTIGKAKIPVTSKRKLRAELHELNIEYRDLAAEAGLGNAAALSRRGEITRRLRILSAELTAREPDVEVTVPRSSTGHPFRIGPSDFWPGVRTMKSSIAQYLMWLIDQDRTNEMNRMRQNGREFDLGTIGDKAKMLSVDDD